MSGAVTLPIDIGGMTYQTVFKFGTMRIAGAEMGKSVMKAFSNDEISEDEISAIWWAVLQPNHRITREGSDNLIDEAGFGDIAAHIAKGVAACYGGGDAEPAAEADAGNAPSPAKKKAKTPKAS